MSAADNAHVLQGQKVGLDSRILGLTIFPTEKCNFRCVYCYEDFPNTKLSSATSNAILSLVRSRISELHSLSIGWFGGEPLLEPKIVLDISKSCKKLAADNNCAFTSHITTNGFFLARELFDDLVASGVTRFQISLDGNSNEHNATRRVRGAADGFSIITKHLLALRSAKAEFQITLRLHAHANNVESIVDLANFLYDHFGGDERFKVTIQKILDHRGGNTAGVSIIDELAFSDLKARIAAILPDAQLIKPSHILQCCYAAMPNHFVIRANGKVQKCTVALYDERNDVGELLPDGTFKWNSQKRLREWSLGLLEGDPKRMSCPWSEMRLRPR
jgi:uncharacterized protein